MESDISELIETAAPTDNEEEEEDIIPVKPVDEEERIEDGYGDKSVDTGTRTGTRQKQTRPWKRMLWRR